MKLEKRDCKERLSANVLGYRIVNLWNSLPEDVVYNVLGYRIGVVNLWNSLPEDVVSADSVNCFKVRFDRLSGSKHFCEEMEDVFWCTSL